MERKKSKKKIIISVIVIIIIAIAFIIGHFVFKDLKQEEILRQEVSSLSKLDITKDRYNKKIKTTGDYAIVEKAIKEYLDDYATTLQDILKILNDKQLTAVLSANNYKNDGPDFIATKKYLETTKSNFNKKLTKLTEMTSEDKIMSKIKSKKLNDYYVDLYKELMLHGIAEEDLSDSKTDLKASSTTINNLLDTEEKVINLLVTNKGKWSIENDKIVFQQTETLNQYNELISNIQ